VGVLNVARYEVRKSHAIPQTAFGRSFPQFSNCRPAWADCASIQIFVVGQAKRQAPTRASLSTVTALSRGGPSSKGSLRSIQLKRGSRVVRTWISMTCSSRATSRVTRKLLPGTSFTYPRWATCRGDRQRQHPAIYELKQDTPLTDLLRWRAASPPRPRPEGHPWSASPIAGCASGGIALDRPGMARVVQDGLVTVYSLVPRFDNAVALAWQRCSAGRFPWRQGMRVRDLIRTRKRSFARLLAGAPTRWWASIVESSGCSINAGTLAADAGGGDRIRRFEIGHRGPAVRREGENSNPTVAEAVRRRQVSRVPSADPDGRRIR